MMLSTIRGFQWLSRRVNAVLVVVLLMLVFSAGLIGFSWQHKSYRAQVFAEIKNQHLVRLKELQQLDLEAESMNVLRSRVIAWQKQGVIGQPERLEWVELIRVIQESRPLLDVQYEFSAPQPLGAASPEGYQFQRSTMKFRLALLHEGDLLYFLNELSQKAPADIRPERCSVTRLNAVSPDQSGTERKWLPTLQAECTVDWINLIPPRQKS